MNLADMSLNDLKDLLKKIPAEIKRRTDEAQNAAKEAAIEKLKAIAQEHGFTLEELTGKRKTKGAGSRGLQEPVAAKYANPDNPSQTWSGRGRQPVWVRDALASGKTLDSLKINHD